MLLRRRYRPKGNEDESKHSEITKVEEEKEKKTVTKKKTPVKKKASSTKKVKADG